MFAVISLILSTMLSPLVLFRLYLSKLWAHLSVIRHCSQPPASRSTAAFNRTYLMSSLAMFIAIYHGTIGLHSKSGQPFTFQSLHSTPYFYFRQFFMWRIWPQTDILMLVLAFSDALVLLNFALKRPIRLGHLFAINSAGNVKLNEKGNAIQFLLRCFEIFSIQL